MPDNVIVRQLPTGTLLVDVAESMVVQSRAVIYARVSSHDQKADLERQVGRVAAWATKQGLQVDQIVTEIGSGLNGSRPKMRKILADASATVILVEHRERLARFGVEYLEAALGSVGRHIIVMDDTELEDDLTRDMIDVLTSFCARLYGKRSARSRASKLVTAMGSAS